MAILTSVTYALKSTHRNFRRSFTLMFGVIISLAIVSGVLFYLDSTSGELVQAAFADVHIDTVISDPTLTETETRALQEFVLSNVSDLITSAEIIAVTEPFGPNTVGSIVAADDQYNLSSMADMRAMFSIERNFTTTYIFGIEPSYFDTFSSIFSTTADVAQIFENDEVLISTPLEEYFIDDTDNILNISLVSFDMSFGTSGPTVDMNVQRSADLIIGGTVNFNTAAMEEVSYAFNPESVDEEDGFTTRLRQFTQIPNCIIMSYSNYMELLEGTEAISLNGVHVKIDHSQLSSNTDTIYSQLGQITTRIEVYGTVEFPNILIVDLLEFALDTVADQLNQMRLFLIYFALPGILLGAYISKYAIDLTIEERQREIGILRTKSALRKDIALTIGVESFIISGIGLAIGILIGYLASILISNILNGGTTGFTVVAMNSLIISVVIGGIIVLVAAFFASRQLLAPSITETLKEGGKEEQPTLWKRIYLDFILLGIAIIVTIMSIIEFDPIPGFSLAIFDFVAPLLTWIGLTLLLVRILEQVLRWLEEPVTKVYRLIFKDLAQVITRNILYKPQRITKITIVLSLTLSFGLVIAIISQTYQQGARDDALYQVGADLRIQFPTTDYLDYNTSDFITAFTTEFNDDIEGTTPFYSVSFRFGRGQTLAVGIEPETFFDVAMLRNSFFQSDNYEATKEILLKNTDNIIISTGIANPDLSGAPGGGFMGRQMPAGFDVEMQTFSVGDVLPIGQFNESDEVIIADIVAHFPAVADLTGRSEEELQYVVCNVDYLINPTPVANRTYLTNKNASYLLVDISDGNKPLDVENAILSWYSQNYPDSVELSIVNVDEYYEEYSSLITSLTGLTSMEFILVLAVSTLGFEIFLTSSLYERKKEYGTYYAIGAPVNDVRKLVLGELSLITGFSLITGILLSAIVSFMYTGFISDLLILELYSMKIPLESIVILIILVVVSMVITILLSGRKLSRLDPVNILRTV